MKHHQLFNPAAILGVERFFPECRAARRWRGDSQLAGGGRSYPSRNPPPCMPHHFKKHPDVAVRSAYRCFYILRRCAPVFSDLRAERLVLQRGCVICGATRWQLNKSEGDLMCESEGAFLRLLCIMRWSSNTAAVGSVYIFAANYFWYRHTDIIHSLGIRRIPGQITRTRNIGDIIKLLHALTF